MQELHLELHLRTGVQILGLFATAFLGILSGCWIGNEAFMPIWDTGAAGDGLNHYSTVLAPIQSLNYSIICEFVWLLPGTFTRVIAGMAS